MTDGLPHVWTHDFLLRYQQRQLLVLPGGRHGVREALGFYAYPNFMRGDINFARYLADNGKREIWRLDIKISNPAGAYNKLMDIMADKWPWGVLLHNCEAFAKVIITSGGGSVQALLNCPDQEFVRKLDKAVDNGIRGFTTCRSAAIYKTPTPAARTASSVSNS